MSTRPSSLSLYNRSTPLGRVLIRRTALSKKCPYCNAPKGQMCRGIGGHVAAPHWARRKDFQP